MMGLSIAAASQYAKDAGVQPADPSLGLLASRALSLPFQLSTSQTPLVAENVGLSLPTSASIGGGFGPTARPGIGVSYFVLPTTLYFHVSASAPASQQEAMQLEPSLRKDAMKPGSPQFLARKFAELVQDSLALLQELLGTRPMMQKAKL